MESIDTLVAELSKPEYAQMVTAGDGGGLLDALNAPDIPGYRYISRDSLINALGSYGLMGVIDTERNNPTSPLRVGCANAMPTLQLWGSEPFRLENSAISALIAGFVATMHITQQQSDAITAGFKPEYISLSEQLIGRDATLQDVADALEVMYHA